jgi:hypothetical protein
MLAAAVGPNLTKLLHDQLDLMMSCGLSDPLKNSLVIIAKYIPPLLKTMQGALKSSNLMKWVCSYNLFRSTVGSSLSGSERAAVSTPRSASVSWEI